MRIDAHQHYWSIERGDYGWITPQVTTLYRDFSPPDLLLHLQKHQLAGSIVVQAAPTLEESLYILQLADKTPSILGVVGWIDFFHGDHIAQLTELNQYSKLVGLRLMLQDMEDSTKVLDPEIIRKIEYYVEREIPLDLLVVANQLDTIIAMLEIFPTMKAVIDHIGKPNIAEGDIDRWSQQMRLISQYKGVYCKLSGMATEADYDNWSYEQFTPYIEHVLHCFGAERVIFGSDWPVCLLAASYDEVMHIVESALPQSWGTEERARLFGFNAAIFYNLVNKGEQDEI